jgi:pimeloyl-ACP methyl ester carboxylesterase
MLKERIKNRKGQSIVVVVDLADNSKGVAFIEHGLGGYKEQEHVVAMADAFFGKGYSTVLFDTTNSFGESDGNYEDATTTNYYEDLEDVIEWASKQEWYQEPFILAGHSTGSMCAMLYAEKYPEKIKSLAPISCAINDNLKEKLEHDESLKEWRENGIKETTGYDGRKKRLKWSFMEDTAKYDPLEGADVLTMPVLLVVGSEDTSTPLEYQEQVKESVNGKVELHIIEGAAHTFRGEKELNELKMIIGNWLESL